MSYSTPARNVQLDALTPLITELSLHEAEPDDTGSDEVVGGGYSRQSCPGFTAANVTARTVAEVGFTITDTTVTHVGLWGDGGLYLGDAELDDPITAVGELRVPLTDLILK